MTEYEAGLAAEVAFPPEIVRSLADAVADAGWRQCHIAETEKYAHVTYFFNGGVEAVHPGEDRRLIPSPKVATYDLAPAMSAVGVTDALVEAIESDAYDLIVANFANPDMVGHTGVWDATIEALTVLDGCLARIVAAIETVEARDPAGPGALLAITADHGNADELRDAGRPRRHRAFAQPGAVRAGRPGGRRASRSRTGCWRTSRRRCSSSPGSRRGTA